MKLSSLLGGTSVCSFGGKKSFPHLSGYLSFVHMFIQLVAQTLVRTARWLRNKTYLLYQRAVLCFVCAIWCAVPEGTNSPIWDQISQILETCSSFNSCNREGSSQVDEQQGTTRKGEPEALCPIFLFFRKSAQLILSIMAALLLLLPSLALVRQTHASRLIWETNLFFPYFTIVHHLFSISIPSKYATTICA